MHLFAAQICFADLDVVGELSGLALHLDRAGLQNISAVGDLQGHLCVLLHQQHGHAVAVDLADDLEDFLDQQRG